MAFRILFLGDLIGAAGAAMFQKHIKRLKHEHSIDAMLVNGENSAHDGRGITPKVMKFFKHHDVSMVTTGNHIWQKKEIYPYLNEHKDLLRPINFPGGCPGSGVGTFKMGDVTVGVVNVQGRVFMREFVSCPIRALESALTFLKTKTNVIIVDMHAEATSEKICLALHFDGLISAFVGTHTHVQTADERILPKGTAYITDLGMSGALNSSIGIKPQAVIYNMLTQMPAKFEVETEPPMVLSGAMIDIDAHSGKAIAIERVRVIDNTVTLDGIDF